jgi:hypothetical protein
VRSHQSPCGRHTSHWEQAKEAELPRKQYSRTGIGAPVGRQRLCLRSYQAELSRSRAPAGAKKRCDPEIQEDPYEDGRSHEGAMIGALHPAGARLPKLWHKDDYRQQKEDARNLKEHDATHAAKGPKESADASATLRSDAPDGLPCGSNLPCSMIGCCSFHSSWCSRITCEPLASHAARNAEPDAERSPNGLRLHSVYDGNSDSLTGTVAQLPIARFRHRK